MKRSYYEKSIREFMNDEEDRILGALTRNHEFSTEELLRNSWIEEIHILKNQLACFQDGDIFFEYSIPRMGKRVDTIISIQGLIILLEFKVGEGKYHSHAKEQVLDYAIDLKNFHSLSHNRMIFPILVATEADETQISFVSYEDKVFEPICCNRLTLKETIANITNKFKDNTISLTDWNHAVYKPTPTIIEAAQALYRGHSVSEISRSDAGAINLSRTSQAINEIIDKSKRENRKSICFITGVPGSGKTLAGLNLANERHNIDEGEHAVFLSGNGPLVIVLQEALARNEVFVSKSQGEKVKKTEVLSRTKAFIQNIHHFRDDLLRGHGIPVEHVAVFDEAQRAWSLEQTTNFMKKKKGLLNFNMSEPNFLLEAMDRHNNWAVMICLIGGGQEINIGEAGLPEWFHALQNGFSRWDIYVSDQLKDREYTRGEDLFANIPEQRLYHLSELHLCVSVRSFRSEKVSELVKKLLDNEPAYAQLVFQEIKKTYPIVLTRELSKAKHWLRKKARGSERIGLLASSGGYRLKPFGIHVKSKIDPKTWFLNDKWDVRSSYYLEEVATEFDIQGLELDWTCLAWDGDLRYESDHWGYYKFKGTQWQRVSNEERILYLVNAYRVLLTRARQGMVIFVPNGNRNDVTRVPKYYDKTYAYLKDIGIPDL